jgi:hypothetical protein
MVLPILNRTFASYPNSDRQAILQKVRQIADSKVEESDGKDLLYWSERHLADAFDILALN